MCMLMVVVVNERRKVYGNSDAPRWCLCSRLVVAVVVIVSDNCGDGGSDAGEW